MSDTEQDESKKDLALILARLYSLIEANSEQNTVGASRDFTITEENNLLADDTSVTDADEDYPELTDIADIDTVRLYAENNDVGIDEAILNTLMTALKPAIDLAANRVIEHVLVDAKQLLKQQLEVEIRETLLNLLRQKPSR